ncbi:unnamed protein product [Ectocarpus sp. 12 AP-2014]
MACSAWCWAFYEASSTGGGQSCVPAKHSHLILRTRWWPLQRFDGEDGGWRVGTDSGVPKLNPGDIGTLVGACERICVRQVCVSILPGFFLVSTPRPPRTRWCISRCVPCALSVPFFDIALACFSIH